MGILERLSSWLEPPHARTLALAVLIVGASLAICAAVVLRLLLHLPADYLQGRDPGPLFPTRSRAASAVVRVGQTVIGLVLIVAGAFASIPGVPGPGLLMVLTGLLLLEVPWRHRLGRQVLRRPAIRRTINRLRRRFGRHPLES